MSFIVEDGTIVSGATSLVSVAEARLYAADRGWTLPASDDDLQVALINATDYVQSLEERLKGYRVSSDQDLCFPRYGVVINRYVEVPSDEIPSDLKLAVTRLAVDAANGDLTTNLSGKETRKEKIGELEVEYFQGGASSAQTQYSQAMNFLSQFLSTSGGFTVSRI